MSDCVITCVKGCEFVVDGVNTSNGGGILTMSGIGPFNVSCLCNGSVYVSNGIEQACIEAGKYKIYPIVLAAIIILSITIIMGYVSNGAGVRK